MRGTLFNKEGQKLISLLSKACLTEDREVLRDCGTEDGLDK